MELDEIVSSRADDAVVFVPKEIFLKSFPQRCTWETLGSLDNPDLVIVATNYQGRKIITQVSKSDFRCQDNEDAAYEENISIRPQQYALLHINDETDIYIKRDDTGYVIDAYPKDDVEPVASTWFLVSELKGDEDCA